MRPTRVHLVCSVSIPDNNNNARPLSTIRSYNGRVIKIHRCCAPASVAFYFSHYFRRCLLVISYHVTFAQNNVGEHPPRRTRLYTPSVSRVNEHNITLHKYAQYKFREFSSVRATEFIFKISYGRLTDCRRTF